jgi:hypothetical protein
MSEHDKIRELLALAAAGALTTAEENRRWRGRRRSSRNKMSRIGVAA